MARARQRLSRAPGPERGEPPDRRAPGPASTRTDEHPIDEHPLDEPDRRARDRRARPTSPTEELATEEPATDEPRVGEPPADDPAADEPAADEPAADDAGGQSSRSCHSPEPPDGRKPSATLMPSIQRFSSAFHVSTR